MNVKSLALKNLSEGKKKLILDANGPGEIKASDITKVPEIEIDGEIGRALEELASFVEEGHNEVEIQEAIYEIAKNNEIEIGQFFEVNYRLLFAQERGPRLGPLLAALDREFVVMRLRREG